MMLPRRALDGAGNVREEEEGKLGPDELLEVVVAGGARRFRPVLMTSLTTFAGLSPIMFETGVQAQFLLPMALSLGFGILFATLVLVFIVPCLYLALEDVRRLMSRLSGRVLPARQAARA